MSSRELLARDAYPTWKRLVSSAKSSVRVFTPYLDGMLPRLLANASVPPERIEVVTELSPAAGSLFYRKQLLAIRRMLGAGFNVRSLPRLHAKVLVCDGSRVTLGSQNFTTYGRSSREATSSPGGEVDTADFLAVLQDWFDGAIPIDPELVSMLLDELIVELEAERTAHDTVVAAFNAIVERRRAQVEALRAGVNNPDFGKRLAGVTARASTRLAQSAVRASVDWAGWDETFLVDDIYSDLTRWLVRNSDGKTTAQTLRKLYMHPVLLTQSGRLGFARIARTRSTYVRFSVDRSGIRVGDEHFRARVRLPQDIDAANLEITLRPESTMSEGGIIMRLAFDGAASELLDAALLAPGTIRTRNYYWTPWRSLDTGALMSAVSEPHFVDELTSDALRPFRYEQLGIDNKNAPKFFPHRAIVRLAATRDRRVLLVSPR